MQARVRLVTSILLGLVTTTVCVALTCFWVRSYWVDEVWAAGPLGNAGTGFSLYSRQGRVLLHVSYNEADRDSPLRRVHRVDRIGSKPLGLGPVMRGTTISWQWGGFGFLKGARPPENSIYLSAVPYFSYPQWKLLTPIWVPILLFAALSFYPDRFLYRHYRRTAAGFCVKCGYDLRASIDRCPECGAIPAVGEANSTDSAAR